MRNHWHDPRFWRWWWHVRLSGQAKAALVFVAAAALGIAGYWSASGLSQTEATSQLVTTIVRTTPERVITSVETVVQKGDVVTVRKDGRTITIQRPGETITNVLTGPERVVTDKVTDTVVRTRTLPPRVVVREGKTVTLPGRTVTTTAPSVTLPSQTVTAPAQTVTTQGPTQTVTREVTQPAQTITREITLPTVTQTITREITLPERTVTETTTLTETETETVTVTETETIKR